jgi:hypothetical protein
MRNTPKKKSAETIARLTDKALTAREAGRRLLALAGTTPKMEGVLRTRVGKL